MDKIMDDIDDDIEIMIYRIDDLLNDNDNSYRWNEDAVEIVKGYLKGLVQTYISPNCSLYHEYDVVKE